MGLERRLFLLVVLVAGLAGIAWLIATSGVPGRDPAVTGGEARPAPETGEQDRPLPVTPPSPAPLSGIVLTFDGERARGAEVRAILLGEDLWPRPDGPPALRATAGPDGRFAFRDLAPEAYLLDARAGDARGFVPAIRVGGEPADCVIRLMESGAVSGRVIGEDGAPVAGAVVTADVGGVLRPYYEAMLGRFSSEALERIEARTDAAGAFRLSPLPAGLTDLEVRADRRETLVVPGVACPVDGIEIRLLDTFGVTGRASKEDGLVVRTDPPCEVELTGDGRFVLRGLVRGRYRIGGSAAGQAFTPREFAVEAGRAPPELRA